MLYISAFQQVSYTNLLTTSLEVFENAIQRVSETFQTALSVLFNNLTLPSFLNEAPKEKAAPKEAPELTLRLHAEISRKLQAAMEQKGLHPQENLGNGNSGTVFLTAPVAAIKAKDLAVKCLKLEKILWVDTYGEVHHKERTTLEEREGEGLALLLPKSAHLARAYGAFFYDPETQNVVYADKDRADRYAHLPIISTVSRAQHGDLSSLVGSMSIEAIAGYGKKIAEAIHAIHQAGILHLDVKPANILIKSEEGYRIKLADFGFSGLKEHEIGGRGITPGYAPVQAIFGGLIDEAADWYSYGVTLYVMATGIKPDLFPTFDSSKITDENLHDLLFNEEKGLLNIDNTKRCSGPEVLAHRFFNSVGR